MILDITCLILTFFVKDSEAMKPHLQGLDGLPCQSQPSIEVNIDLLF